MLLEAADELEKKLNAEEREKLMEQITARISGAQMQAPLAKIVGGERAEKEFYEISVNAAEITDDVLVIKESPKDAEITMLHSVVRQLAEEHGSGILAAIDAVRVVNNVDPLSSGTVPYGMIAKEDERKILLLDRDSFANEQLLYLVLEHELKESIMTIIPYENEAVRELTTNYLSLKTALAKELDIDYEKLKDLGADLQFFAALEVLQAYKNAGEEVTDKMIIAAALEHMRAMPYYESLFRQFPFAAKWQDSMAAVKEARARYKAALRVFNEIAEAKQTVKKVKRTAGRAVVTIAGFSKCAKKVKMLMSRLPIIEMDMAGALLEEGKYIKLDIDELIKPGNTHLRAWLKSILRGKTESPFVFFSASGKNEMREFLRKYGFDSNTMFLSEEQLLAKKADRRDIITVIDLAQSRDKKRSADSMYLPLVYSISSVYLAFQVVLADGDINEIDDKLARSSLKTFYELLFGRSLWAEEWQQLFNGELLPPVKKQSDMLDNLRKAIVEIEKSA